MPPTFGLAPLLVDKFQYPCTTTPLHYSKTLEKLQLINWNEWLDISNDQTINEMYNSFDSKMQESLVFEADKIKQKKQPQLRFTYEISTLKKQD